MYYGYLSYVFLVQVFAVDTLTVRMMYSLYYKIESGARYTCLNRKTHCINSRNCLCVTITFLQVFILRFYDRCFYILVSLNETFILY